MMSCCCSQLGQFGLVDGSKQQTTTCDLDENEPSVKQTLGNDETISAVRLEGGKER